MLRRLIVFVICCLAFSNCNLFQEEEEKDECPDSDIEIEDGDGCFSYKDDGYNFSWQIETVDGAGHSSSQMQPRAAEILFSN